jgi:hypothetical protein
MFVFVVYLKTFTVAKNIQRQMARGLLNNYWKGYDLGEKSVTVPHCSPKFPQGLTRRKRRPPEWEAGD